MPPRPFRATARSGSAPRSTSTGPTSASPGICWARSRCTTPSPSTPCSPGAELWRAWARSADEDDGGDDAVARPDLDRGLGGVGGDSDGRYLAGPVIGDVGQLAVRRERDERREAGHRDGLARPAGSGADRDHPELLRDVVAHVGGPAVRRDRDDAGGLANVDLLADPAGGDVDRRHVAAVASFGLAEDVGRLAVGRHDDLKRTAVRDLDGLAGPVVPGRYGSDGARVETCDVGCLPVRRDGDRVREVADPDEALRPARGDVDRGDLAAG